MMREKTAYFDNFSPSYGIGIAKPDRGRQLYLRRKSHRNTYRRFLFGNDKDAVEATDTVNHAKCIIDEVVVVIHIA